VQSEYKKVGGKADENLILISEASSLGLIIKKGWFNVHQILESQAVKARSIDCYCF
jgi:hypothetical protein